MFKKSAMLLSTILACGLAAAAQEVKSEATISATGIFTANSANNGLRHRATDTGGVLAGYRYNFNRWGAIEANYGWNRNSQEFFGVSGVNRIQTDIQQATADFVVRTPTYGHFRPYLLGGGGVLFFDPVQRNVPLTSSLGGPQTLTRIPTRGTGTYVYGGGADIDLTTRGSRLSGVSLRLGYRGYAYKVPDFGFGQLNLNTWTHTAAPEAGLTFRF